MNPIDMSKAAPPRIFLVVVDESVEMPVALYYASRRARRTGGRVAMLRVIPREEAHGLASVAALMREEARHEAEQLLLRLAGDLVAETGVLPVFYIREGIPSEQVVNLVNNDPTVSILVLAAGAGADGPGPLISYLASKAIWKLRVPLTIVPGSLSYEQIDALT